MVPGATGGLDCRRLQAGKFREKLIFKDILALQRPPSLQ
jgi:hypothetical protein